MRRRCDNACCVFSSRSRLPEECVEGPMSDQRRKNKQAEKELHHISEKLSHRLEELDQVLRRRGDFAFMLQRCPVLI